MRCNEVVREMAVPTGDLRASRDRRAPGSLSGVCGLGRACQGPGSALEGHPAARADSRSLGLSMGGLEHFARCLDAKTG